jgi:NADH-quinone oxidoreductase subunit J
VGAALAAGVLTLLAAGMALAAQPEAAATAAAGQGSGGQIWAFYIIGGLTVIGAVATVSRRNPVVAAVCLVGTLFCSAGLYLLLHATFLAAMQVLVYAGAIMVLFVFVIMSVEHPEKEETGLFKSTGTKALGVLAMVALLWRVVTVLRDPREIRVAGEVSDSFGDVASVGRLLFSDYLFPFEAISVLLLTAIVGAVVVSRHRARQEAEK